MQCMTVFHVMMLSCIICYSHSIPNDAEVKNRCAREPPWTNPERHPGDGGFRIAVDNDLDLRQYDPQHMYRISITGTSVERMLSGAYLVAVPFNSSNEDVTVGKFHLVDGGRMAVHVACSRILTTVDSLPKAEVYAMWTSPALDSGCVEFRATVIADGAWYKDDGALTKVLCDDGSSDNVRNTGDVSSEVDCCACGTAKYQLTFHSLPSRSIHAHGSAELDTSLLRWSPVVGSSHSKHYLMWRFGEMASQGIGDICQFGDTRVLEDEIRRQSSNIRTVIKTPGIEWTAERGLQQQRWAHFSVDRRHHQLSVLSQLSPSPDWCVGVSALDLCLDNCTWLADIVVRLFAWDAGVDNGDRNAPSRPIHHIPTRVDNTPGVPFSSGRLAEPVALLRLHRFDAKQDEEDTGCTNTVVKDQGMGKVDKPDKEVNRPHQDSCVMGPWSVWSGCSVTCGDGSRTRTRAAVPATEACSVETRSESCRAVDCPVNCDLRSWSEWSACTDGFALCSPHAAHTTACYRRRNRFFRHPGAESVCSEAVLEEQPCEPADTVFNTDVMTKCFVPADSGPCTRNLRRWYFDVILTGCQTFLYGGCRGNANRYMTEKECMLACRQYGRYVEQSNTEGVVSVVTPSSKVLLTDSSKITESHDAGSTADVAVNCIMSSWSPWSECSSSCGRSGVRTRLRTVVRPPSGGGRKCPRRRLRRRRCSRPASAGTSQCQYTEWSAWSPCARSCGVDTVQERIQRVQGSLCQRSLCPVQLQRRICALPRCFDN